MGVDGWMISALVVVGGVISQFAINRYQNGEFKNQIKMMTQKQDEFTKFMNEKTPLLDHLSKIEDEMRVQVSRQTEEIINLRGRVSQAPLMKEVRDEFVSKEIFIQFEKHIDLKFDMLRDGQDLILQELKKG